MHNFVFLNKLFIKLPIELEYFSENNPDNNLFTDYFETYLKCIKFLGFPGKSSSLVYGISDSMYHEISFTRASTACALPHINQSVLTPANVYNFRRYIIPTGVLLIPFSVTMNVL